MTVLVKVPDLAEEIEVEGDEMFIEDGVLAIFNGDELMAYFQEYSRARKVPELDDDVLERAVNGFRGKSVEQTADVAAYADDDEDDSDDSDDDSDD